MGKRKSFWRSVRDLLIKQIASKAIAGVLTAAVAVYYIVSPDLKALPWWAWVLIVVALVLIIAAIIWLRPARFYYRWKVSEWSGIRRVYAVRAWNAKDHDEIQTGQRDSAEEALVELARTEKKIRLLLASGYHHIGSTKKRGLLYDALDTRHKPFSLEVLLLNPAHAQPRAEIASVPLDQYREGMKAVIWTLAQWKRAHGIDVRVWTYSEEPIWQMFLTDTELWLLCAKRVRTDASNIYCLKLDAEFGLARGLEAVWERRMGSAIAVDLDAVEQPRWELVQSIPKMGMTPAAED